MGIEDPDYDVVVIGAGFAGATAARELATRGRRTLVLEARPKVGGRVDTTVLANGEIVEIGGTYVHWFQPHLWSELTRYGFVDDVIEDGEPPEMALSPTDGGGLGWTDATSYAKRIRRLLTEFFEGSERIIPRPFRPGHALEQVSRVDSWSIADRLDQMPLGEADRAVLESFFDVHTGLPSTQGSYLAEVRWWAPSGHEHRLMQESVWTYKLGCGMSCVVDALLADGGADLRVAAPVTRIDHDADGVLVATSPGEHYRARAVIVATPSGVWPDLEVVPALDPVRLAAAGEGLQAAGGSKGYIVVRGEARAVTIQPRSGHPLGALTTSHRRTPDEQVMVFFGTPALADATDIHEVQAAVSALLPHAEVVELVGRNYDHRDPTVRGGWPVLRPDQFSTYEPHVRLQAMEGRIAFATSDIATGWTGFIDGAIESGIIAAAQVQRILPSQAT